MKAVRPVPILMYHLVDVSVPPGFERHALSAERFAGQMRWLRRLRYEPISLGRLGSALSGAAPWPHRGVVLTFDDGYAAYRDHVLPVLEAFHLPATFFIVAGMLDKTSEWLRVPYGLDLPLVGQRDLQSMAANGHEIGAHTMNHANLTDLTVKQRDHELREARSQLEAVLNRPVDQMAYPYGAADASVRAQAVATGYRQACSVEIGLVKPGDDPWMLRRVHVLGTDSFVDFLTGLWWGWPVRALAQMGRARFRRFLQRGQA